MTENVSAAPPPTETVPAGHLPPWQMGEMPAPPHAGWRLWVGLLGPGVVLAGTSIGSGEWLFGPAVSAQYGATLMWLASISIVFQVFCNLMMMRYAIYCGEPIVVGILRTKPGPKLLQYSPFQMDLRQARFGSWVQDDCRFIPGSL